MTPPEKSVVSLPVFTFDGRHFSKKQVALIREMPLEIFLNGRRLAIIACSGLHMDELALGYLRSEGFISGASDIRDIRIDLEAGAVYLLTSADLASGPTVDCFTDNIASSGARSRFGNSRRNLFNPLIQEVLSLSPEQVLQLMDAFIDLCYLHAETRGTHGAALTDGKEILLVREDIGRHNAIDMLTGYAILHHWDCSDKAVLRTGRVSTEIVYKVWNLGAPLVVSMAAPTMRAIELAEEAGMTLIGAIRGRSMQVYTHERRIGL